MHLQSSRNSCIPAIAGLFDLCGDGIGPNDARLRDGLCLGSTRCTDSISHA